MYTPPTLTPVGDFKSVTNGAGKARARDFFGLPALFVIYWSWT